MNKSSSGWIKIKKTLVNFLSQIRFKYFNFFLG